MVMIDFHMRVGHMLTGVSCVVLQKRPEGVGCCGNSINVLIKYMAMQLTCGALAGSYTKGPGASCERVDLNTKGIVGKWVKVIEMA